MSDPREVRKAAMEDAAKICDSMVKTILFIHPEKEKDPAVVYLRAAAQTIREVAGYA
ncbi:hypothetical protein [Roseomonas indoligenes]|uniref:Uncharacterized protein n=1 Tax=Roseomonas indoligenes TaxID=2820811 RepID=A0A940MUI7_9PROT|nr:hypothetical protein [Pararoseomonas indoligenes]MBP0492231.1 hypothetical protein [Pararoseomonas indoligenes]